MYTGGLEAGVCWDGRNRGYALVKLVKLVTLAVFTCCFVMVLTVCSQTVCAYAYDSSGMNDYGGWSVGPAVYSDGRYVYCIEPGAITPLSPTSEPQIVDELRGYSVRSVDSLGWSGPVAVAKLSGDALREMNYVLTKYGQSPDPRTRVAAQLAIWTIRLAPNQHPWLSHHLNWVGAHGGGWELGRAAEMVQQAQTDSLTSTLEQPGDVMLYANEEALPSPWSGRVKFPIGTRSLRIEGATFEGGSDAVSTDSSVAGELNWVATLNSSGWSGKQVVTVHGIGTGEQKTWPAAIQVFPPGEMFEQSQAAGIGPVADSAEVSYPPVTVQRELTFQPELHTQVKHRELQSWKGNFVDMITVTSGVRDKWPSRGLDDAEQEFLPIVVEGQLFGPFAKPQQIASAAPGQATIAATGKFVADAGEGEYEFTADTIPDAPGYYYWQWTIDFESQTDEVRESGIIPAGYQYSDEFAVSSEEYVVATDFDVKTELAEPIVTRDSLTYEDLVFVKSRAGEWPADDAGERIPVVLRQRVFQDTEQPKRAKQAPPGVQAIHEEVLTTHGQSNPISTGKVRLPSQTSGWITIQTCVFKEDQPEALQPLIVEGCDDYGIPEETARVENPSLAHTGTGITSGVNSIALIGGGSVLLGCVTMVLRKGFKRFQD